MAAGVALAWIDTRPGFDDTGVLIGLLILAGIGAVVFAGAPSTGRGWLLGVLVGGPTPILEIRNGGQAAAVVALVVALAATLLGSLVLRFVSPSEPMAR